jgi:hypothetical protein
MVAEVAGCGWVGRVPEDDQRRGNRYGEQNARVRPKFGETR